MRKKIPPPPPVVDDDLLTRKQVADLFRIHPKTVDRRVKRNVLPAPIEGTKPALFSRIVMKRFLGKQSKLERHK